MSKPVPDPAQLDPTNEAHRAWLRAFYTRLYCWWLANVAPVVTQTAGPADVDEDQARMKSKLVSTRQLTDAEQAELVRQLEDLGHSPRPAGETWYEHTYRETGS